MSDACHREDLAAARRPSGVCIPTRQPAASSAAHLTAGLVAGLLGLTAAQAEAAPAIGLKGKTLMAKGTAGQRPARAAPPCRAHPDKIDVDVGDNGSADLVVARNKVNRIRVKGGGGNDQIRIDDANGAFTTTIPTRIDGQGGNDAIRGGVGAERLNGDGGSDTIDGNGGNDVANLGAGDDRFIWDPGDGSDTVEGRKGADTMTFNGSGANENFRVSANGRRTRLTRDVGDHHHGLQRHRDRRRQLAGRQRHRSTVDDLAGTKVRTVNHDEAAVARRLGSRHRQRPDGRQRDQHRRTTITAAGAGQRRVGRGARRDGGHPARRRGERRAGRSTRSAATTASTRARWAPTP